jgi:enterochelin esterase family protein
MIKLIYIFSFSLLTCLVSAQPQVNADKTVSFRVFAPKADSVKIEGDIIMEFTKKFDFDSNMQIPMTKGANGIWSVTLGPLNPSPYLYNIQIDGRSIPDPNNFRIFSGQKYRKSILLVNSPDTSELWEIQKAGYGTVHHHTYFSPTAKSLTELYVYTPPGYEKSNIRYPVLYLLHGRGEKADSWLSAGFVNNIMDNLIARNKVNPTIIVMPFGWLIAPKTPDSQVINLLMINLEKEMFTSIIPLIEGTYRVFNDAGHRSIAGFSMGAAQTAYIGLNNTDKFSYIGIFSAGLPNFKIDHKELLDDPVETNKRLKYFFLGAGSQDNIGPGGSSIDGQKSLDILLSAAGIKHTFYEMPDAGHTWYAWRFYLSEHISVEIVILILKKKPQSD